MKCPYCKREGMTTSECLRQTLGKPFMVSISPIKPPSHCKDAVESLLESLGDRREAVEKRLEEIEMIEFDCAECGETLTVQHECKDEMLDDGFGMECSPYCPDCGNKSMSIVRPGKVQCGVCARKSGLGC